MAAMPGAPAGAGHASAEGVPAHAWHVAVVLMLANMVAFLDRAILSLLMDPIKADLGASDAAMGLLHGFAFALLYSAAGVPIARLADRANRRNIIMAGFALWTAMTALCGLARTYAALFLARVGVGVGEASLAPAAYSILADYFPARRLPQAMGLFAAGIYLGNGIAIIGGGLLMEAFTRAGGAHWPLLGHLAPWQSTFVVAGLLGIPTMLLMLTVREPPRAAGARAAEHPPFAAVLGFLVRNWRCHGALILGFSLLIMLGYGSSAWWPAFFQRTHGWSFEDIGLRFGIVVLVFGTAGALAGGWLAAALRRRGRADANMLSAMIGAALLLPAYVAAPLAPNGQLALACLALVNFAAAIPFGGGYAAIQEATPAAIRAQVSALFLLSVNLIGVGLGPVLIGLVNDRFFARPEDLRYAILACALVIMPLAVAVLIAGRPAYAAATRAAGCWQTGGSPSAGRT